MSFPTDSYPLQLKPDFDQYLQSYPITSITPFIENIAQQLSADASTVEKLLRRTKQWINNNGYDQNKKPIYKAQSLVESRLTPAQQAIDKHMVSCGSFATIAAAILRAAGIPVRLVDGTHVQSTDHAWIEVYSPNAQNWLPFDLTGYGHPQTGFSDHQHTKHSHCLDWSHIAEQLQQRHQAWQQARTQPS